MPQLQGNDRGQEEDVFPGLPITLPAVAAKIDKYGPEWADQQKKYKNVSQHTNNARVAVSI